MFDITFYTNKSEQIKLDKDLTTIATLTGEMVNSASILSPSILIDGDIELIKNANYFYIPQFGRYYFLTSPASYVNGLWEIGGTCDVLSSWKSYIRQQTAIVAKQENEYNLFLNDGTLMAYSNPHIITKTFPDGFGDTYDMVLTVVGGGKEE